MAKPIWLDEFLEVGGQYTNGIATLYHGTTKQKAQQIIKDKVFRAPSDAPDTYGVYFSSSKEHVSRDYGDGTVLVVRVRGRDLHLDDVAPGRYVDFYVETRKGMYRPVSVKLANPCKSEEGGRMKRNPKSRQPKPYAVIGGFEYWLGKDGEIYRNLKGNRGPIADTGLPNNVRWECSKEHFDRYRKFGVFGKEENPSLFGSSTSDMFEDFHGYPSTSHTEIEEEEKYRSNLAELGGLEELEILEANGKSVIPISFGHDVIVACDKWGKQIYFEGGNQELDLDALIDAKLIDEHEAEKDLVTIGEVFSISYYTTKTHLKGPKKASSYIHQFGEDGGSLPTLLYDRLNKKMMLSGGSYKIKDVGIVN